MAMPDRLVPTLVFLHFLGGSARTWHQVEEALSDRFACLRLDLPGFGEAAGADGYSVAAMADRVSARVAAVAPERWVLVGHSMGAKVALLLARRGEDGDPSLSGLCGLVLAAGSPPGPEPMEDDKRAEMLGWFGGDADLSRAEADGFVQANVARALVDEAREGAVADVLRMARPAWRAWLTDGSREDLRNAVGVVRMPALVLAGAEDAALGPAVQHALMVPHLANGRVEILDGCAHLLPLEDPQQVAVLIAVHVASLAEDFEGRHDDRMTTRTRQALQRRGQPDDPGYRPRVLEDDLLGVLRAVVNRVIPQQRTAIDLAARIDAMLAEGNGDGWRFAALPPDAEAYRCGLRTLDARARTIHARPFAELTEATQDSLLQGVVECKLGLEESAAGQLDPAAMALWFQEMRADATRLFMSHPATLAVMGCDALVTGGDAELVGFVPYRAVDTVGAGS